MVHFPLLIVVATSIAAREPALPVTLTIDLDHPTAITNAAAALGGCIDGHEKGRSKQVLCSKSVHQMLQAGLKPLAYRLRTELGVEAWHWNPAGTWSDKKHHQGYWTSSKKIGAPIIQSYGYRLPRRGDTLDEANNDSYSRLDDGDLNTFWKSNPYLTSYYTGESDEQHPQWVVLDFRKPVLINTARLHWGIPYAKNFRIQYAKGGDLFFGHNKGWHDFLKGKITHGVGGAPLLDLGKPHWVQFVRILMSKSSGYPFNLDDKKVRPSSEPPRSSEQGQLFKGKFAGAVNGCGSGTAAPTSTDPRDYMGYALSEVELGLLKDGRFHDHVVHRPDQQQTMVTVSSTDPWHKASDLDEKTEQPGIDAVATSKLSHQEPTLWSLPVLYDTPENATQLVAYLQRRGYLTQHQRIELGEEPDGQHVDPKDFGELYSQVVKKIDDPSLQFGGPSFVTIDVQPKDTTYRFDHRPWLKRFFNQLRRKHQEKKFQFLTFEWYPFDDLLLPAPELLCKHAGSLHRAMNLMSHGGVPKKMPFLITEYGYSVFSGEPEVQMEAALLNAEIVCEFLASGGTTAYLYGYEPNTLECGISNSWGNLMMLLEHRNSLIPLPTFYAARMMTDLVQEQTTIFPMNSSQNELIGYAFYQQNTHRWSLLLINKNPKSYYELHVHWKKDRNPLMGLYEKIRGPFSMLDNRKIRPSSEFLLNSEEGQYFKEKHFSNVNGYNISYSPECYQWHADGPNGSPSKNKPPIHQLIRIEKETPTSIAPWSITILKKQNPSVIW